MSQSANVRSIDVLRQLRTALCSFGEDAQEALAAAEQEIRRTTDWLQRQLEYWQRQVRERGEEVVRAKTAIVQRRWGHQEGRGPGTTEAEMALKEAQRRLKEAEEKVQTVRRWINLLPREINEYQGPARRLGGFIEADLKHATAVLESKIASLEAYVALTAPGGSSPAPEGGAEPAPAPAQAPPATPAATEGGTP